MYIENAAGLKDLDLFGEIASGNEVGWERQIIGK